MSDKPRGRKAGVKTAPDGETKADKFKRLGNKRLVKTQKAMKQIRNLASSQYEYTPAQVETIVSVLQKAVDSIRDSFTGKVETEAPIEL